MYQKQAIPNTQPLQPSYPSGVEKPQLNEGFFKGVKQSIYRIGQSDIWGVELCFR